MANGAQIKSLLKAHYDGEDEKFKTISLQIAASEARAGHTTLALEIKNIIETDSNKRKIVKMNNNSMFDCEISKHKQNELVVSDEINSRIERIILEYRQRNKLRKYGMENRSKILIEGVPGTGKTLTSSILASELNLPLYIVQMDKIITKFMGETSTKLRQIFEFIEESRAVFLFDEFDAIGANRNLDNEVGEMRRVLNSFLQFLENNSSDSIIIAATNNYKLLDPALFRRFDDILHYELPNREEIKKLYCLKLGKFYNKKSVSNHIIDLSVGLSHAEITKVCENCIKNSILSNTKITCGAIEKCLRERMDIYAGKEA